MKILGLIGGTSWHSTVEYYRGINEKVIEKVGTASNPELILYSIDIDIMRSRDWDRINAKYLDVSQRLEEAGAEAILICANTPHMTYDYVQPKIGIEVLHIADAIGRKAQHLGLKNLALFGNKPTITGSFIPDVLKEKYNIHTLLPDAEAIEKSNDFVSTELTQGVFSNEAVAFYQEQIRTLKLAGADGAILGCTELPILLKDLPTDLPTLSTTDLHIDMAVEFILG